MEKSSIIVPAVASDKRPAARDAYNEFCPFPASKEGRKKGEVKNCDCPICKGEKPHELTAI